MTRSVNSWVVKVLWTLLVPRTSTLVSPTGMVTPPKVNSVTEGSAAGVSFVSMTWIWWFGVTAVSPLAQNTRTS